MTEALSLLDQVLEQDASMNVMSQNTLTVTYLAEAHPLAGHVPDATDHAVRAMTLARERNEPGYQAWIHRLLGEIAVGHDADGATAPYLDALKLAEELGMRPLEAHCHLGLGRLRRRAGNSAAAAVQLARAATMYRDMEMMFWLEQAETELASAS